MIKAVEITGVENIYKNKYDNDLKYLYSLNKVNIFIGENNSGKSRLLRYLITSDKVVNISGPFSDEETKSFKKSKSNFLVSINKYNNISEKKIILPQNVIELDDANFYCEASDYINSLKINSSNILNPNVKEQYKSIKLYLDEMHNYIVKEKNFHINETLKSLDIIYIPILRGIELFNNYYELTHEKELDTIQMTASQRNAIEEYKLNSKHVYLNKVSKAYNINTKIIFTAEDLFDDIKDKLLGEEKDRKFVKDFENFISKEFYNDEGFTIIPQLKKGYLNIKIGNGEERALHELGDGIKQLITIFYKMYDKKNNSTIFFIEEPELNLHPGYQRLFINILQNCKEFKDQQFFITTHSNHIIDCCLDYTNTSIYKFINSNKKNNSFKVVNTSSKDIEVLELLGVKNTSVFISNCTIWVEGISDKILISKYLEVYLKGKSTVQYKEDINYAFIEYGGNNITHWAFIDNKDISTINASGISNRCYIILDNDNDSPTKVKRKRNLKKAFKDKYYELKVREIENTISRKVLEKTLFPNGNIKYSKLYEGQAYATKEVYMGSFIDKHYELSRKYGSKSTGTIINKLEFSKKIAENIKNTDDLTIPIKNMCEKLYKFIEESNYRKEK
ncbi:uncharacterized protein BN721_00686 [Firmicutes bacterium CAG:582]|nr:uncharacterized protein BN721_00686 [Firmicutes bacterium CAG:582]